MENASKALIIAGAILISILLISVGIMVMNSTKGIQDQMGTEMSAAEIKSFNAKFQNYQGTQRGSQVRGLISDVIASNAANGSNGRKITITSGDTGTTTGTDETGDLSGFSAKVQPSNQYTVTLSTDTTTGLVTSIHIAGKFTS